MSVGILKKYYISNNYQAHHGIKGRLQCEIAATDRKFWRDLLSVKTETEK